MPRTYESVVRDLLYRLFLVIALILLTAFVLWLDRGGLRDNARPGQPLDFLAVLYYAVVTLTTVGYGDITPVTDFARIINVVFVTPIRMVILIIFVGTAYELVLQRTQEAFRMRRLQAQLNRHTIVCGYGVKGRASVEELLSFGTPRNQIVVIDNDQKSVEDAADAEITALCGDATSEAALRAAAIEKAAHVIVDVDTDDTTVLICLTAKHLNPAVQIAAAAREAENVPLLYRSGADVVVASAVASGRMLAMATWQHYAPRFIEDIITFGRGMDIGERTVRPEEAGLSAASLPDLADKLVLGAYHDQQRYPFNRLSELRLQPGDTIVYLATKP
ncbi:MAG: potassium channel family protein [Armatimonadota bacterium]